jgi:hypothetical protein
MVLRRVYNCRPSLALFAVVRNDGNVNKLAAATPEVCKNSLLFIVMVFD